MHHPNLVGRKAVSMVDWNLMFVLFLVFGTTSDLKQSLWTLKPPKNISTNTRKNMHTYTPRSLTWIPKRMVWKMYLRLQEWLFCVIIYVKFREGIQFWLCFFLYCFWFGWAQSFDFRYEYWRISCWGRSFQCGLVDCGKWISTIHHLRYVKHQTLKIWLPLMGNIYLINILIALPETNVFAPENGWLGDDPFLLGAFRPSFRCVCC